MDNDDVLTIFRDSALAVIPALAATPVKYVSTSLKADPTGENECVAVLDFAGESKGSAAVCMSLALARRLFASATSMPIEKVTPAFANDTVRELTNEIVGHAKAPLLGTSYYYTLGIPRSLEPPGGRFTQSAVGPCVRMAFDSAEGEVVVLLSMVSAEGTPVVPGGRSGSANQVTGRTP
jgi:CheY-specific phosphatase CheX